MAQRLATVILLSSILGHTSLALCSANAQLDLSPFVKTIYLTKDGMQEFYGRYNHPIYTKHVLPRSCWNEIDLLEYTKDQKRPYDYAYNVLSLFHQRFKGCLYKSAAPLNHFLESLPRLIGFLFENKTNKQEVLREHLWNTLYEPNGIYIPACQVETFIEQLQQSIDQTVLKPAQSLERTQQVLMRFIESMLDKLLWDFKEPEQAWDLCKAIMNNLKVLQDYHIIPDNDTFNHFLWSVVYRFGSQIELQGALVSFDVYKRIAQEISQGTVPLLQTREKDPLIRSKMTAFCNSLALGQAAAIAYHKGIFTGLPSIRS